MNELPKEFVDKFAVKDTTQVTPPKPVATRVEELRTYHGHSSHSRPLRVRRRYRDRGRLHPKWHPRKKIKKVAHPATVWSIPDRRPAKDPLWVGEKLEYEITYFGMVAANVTIQILPFKQIDGRKVYHIEGHAKSSAVFGLFYKLDDMAETFMDYYGLFPYRFHLVLNETKQSRDALELYDQQKHQTFYWNRWNHGNSGYTESKQYGKIEPWAQDSISSLFYVRTLPLPTGAKITFPVASEGKDWDLVVTVLRREMLDTPLGRIKTIVIRPQTKFHGVLKSKGNSYMWLTDDDRHLLVRMEAKVKIGTVVARLTKVDSLGTPPTQTAK